MLLQPTEKGFTAIKKIQPQHAAFAKLLEERLGKEQMQKMLDAMTVLRHTLETIVLPEH